MAFAIFDIETRIDRRLLREVFYPDAATVDEALQRFRAERADRGGSDFAPLALHLPISVAVGNVGDDYVLRTVENLALDDYSEERLVREFWSRAEAFAGTLVSFNGRAFDLPVLELQALRYGIAIPAHFAQNGGRHRYAEERHLDLYDLLTNHGAVRIRGGLDLLLKLIGMPGKIGIDGSQVEELYEAGRLGDIHRYCRSDVIQTYFLFLRVELMRGRIDDAAYRAACDSCANFRAELRSTGSAQ